MMLITSKFVYKLSKRPLNQVINFLYQNRHNNILRYGNLEFTYKCFEKNSILIKNDKNPAHVK